MVNCENNTSDCFMLRAIHPVSVYLLEITFSHFGIYRGINQTVTIIFIVLVNSLFKRNY